MTGVGLDLLEIDRLARALARRPRLAERLFTAGERDYAERHARPGRHLAARFAAKEAVIKALGRPIAPSEIEVVADPAPRVTLRGRAAEAGAGRELAISLTHSRETAAAVALAL